MIAFALLGMSGGLVLFIYSLVAGRSAAEVLENLARASDAGEEKAERQPSGGKHRTFSGAPLVGPVAGGCAGAALAFLFGSSAIIPAGAIGGGVGHLVMNGKGRRRAERERREVEFVLPLVMERVVMAVGTGLDILPALQAVYQLELEEVSGDVSRIDPVSNLLLEVVKATESGRTVDEALHEVADKSTVTAVRHAFVHLALAYREGGELTVPLRELGEATELYYQESLEEGLAKLPVKATMPLLVTFAGLILVFLTSPIVQVLLMSKQIVPGR